jgi:hypothetical protein
MKLVANRVVGAATVTVQVVVLSVVTGLAFETVVIVYTYTPAVLADEGVTEIFVRPEIPELYYYNFF